MATCKNCGHVQRLHEGDYHSNLYVSYSSHSHDYEYETQNIEWCPCEKFEPE